MDLPNCMCTTPFNLIITPAADTRCSFRSCAIIESSIRLKSRRLRLPVFVFTHHRPADGAQNIPHAVSDYTYLSDAPCLTCNRRPSSMLCTTCPANMIAHVRHSVDVDCTECCGRSLAPSGGPTEEHWVCACTIWDKTSGKVTDDEIVDLEEEFLDQVGLDELVAVKLDSEWSSK